MVSAMLPSASLVAKAECGVRMTCSGGQGECALENNRLSQSGCQLPVPGQGWACNAIHTARATLSPLACNQLKQPLPAAEVAPNHNCQAANLWEALEVGPAAVPLVHAVLGGHLHPVLIKQTALVLIAACSSQVQGRDTTARCRGGTSCRQ